MNLGRYAIFGVAVTALLLANMTGSAVAVAFPKMVTDLNTSIVWVGWALTAYKMAEIGLLPIAGKASDSFGRKRVFVVSIVLYCTGCLAASIAPTIHLLIVARIVQAAGQAGFMPSAAGIIADVYPESRAKMIGLFSSVVPIGQIIGPNIGAFLVDSLGWRSVFWLPLPLAVLLIAGAAYWFPKDGKRNPRTMDLQGAFLLAGGLSLALLSLSHLGKGFNTSSLSWFAVYAALSAIFLFRFVTRERKLADPLVDLSLLRTRPFAAANFYHVIFGGATTTVGALIPLYAVSVLGLSTVASGFVLTPRSVAIIAASAGTSFMLTRLGYRKPMLAAAAVLFACFLLLATVKHVAPFGINLEGSLLLLVIVFVFGLGIGMSNPAANNACIELMPDKVASIMALRGVFRNCGDALAISLSTIVLELLGSARGFTLIYLAGAAAMLISVPLIFMLPNGMAGTRHAVPYKHH